MTTATHVQPVLTAVSAFSGRMTTATHVHNANTHLLEE